jgi:formylglycine-generating enzyme required for sulfatase activity
MKYEISQGQYADFLNTLTSTQQSGRYYDGSSTYRHFIEVQVGVYGCDANDNNTLNESNDGEWVACNYLSWADGAAYADWAGLRPITELEFEKVCRGAGQSASIDEYAWGNTTLERTTSSLNFIGSANETPNQGNCNYDFCSPDGPYRVGSYADAGSSRQNAGASYYGVMEMSGNLWERPVTVGNSDGRSFTGEHGDGSLDGSGDANVSNWPAPSTASGAGIRGGVWRLGTAYLRVSDRYYAAYTVADRYYGRGWRGVRVAP